MIADDIEADFDVVSARQGGREQWLDHNPDEQQVGCYILNGMIAERFGDNNIGSPPGQWCPSCQLAWVDPGFCWECGKPGERRP